MASPFSMQNLLASLPGSTGTPDLSNPMSLVSSNPQINTQQLATGVQDIKDSKNQKLSLMLYALGGALKGDKDFVQNTLALQQMQEGKKKQEAQKKKYEEFLAKLPEGSFKDLATTLGPSKLDDLLLERYKAEQPKEIDPSKAIKAEEFKVLNKLEQVGGDISKLNEYEKRIYENYIRGQKPGLADILLSEVAGGSLSLSGGGDEPLVITQVNP